MAALLRRSSSHLLRRLRLPFAADARRTSATAAADAPKSNLSARMSFVFDQIDAIERERNEKDQTLQRIRAWREKRHQPDAGQTAGAVPEAAKSEEVSDAAEEKGENLLAGKEIELAHPWPEWVEFMELLMRQNYFDHRRKDERRSVAKLDDSLISFVEEGIDFTRDFATVRTACVNFGRDRFDILRPLSRKDIQVLVGYGCPSTDIKLTFSAKVLRKYVHLDEGDVCSACSLRNSCSKAYLLTRKEDEARTVDVIRLLLIYGFDPINGAVVNKSLMTNKSLKTVIRKLLYEIGKLGSVPIDPNLPPPIIKKPPPKIKQPPPPPKKRVGRDDVEMKKGDWLCPKCDFMNFAKNVICLRCDVKRPKRQLLPGEWECPGCNFLNYRRNVVCHQCEHKRPPDEYMENSFQERQERQNRPETRLQRLARNPVVPDAWNIDFDDNESDGADVAAFEFADPPKADGLYSKSNQNHDIGKVQEFQGDDMLGSRQAQGVRDDQQYSEPRRRWGPTSDAKGTGFDDFDDEDDDDVDSYEIDSPDNKSKQESTWLSGSHDFHDTVDDSQLMQRQMPLSNSRYNESDLDSDRENSDHSNLKSSHLYIGRHTSKRENGRNSGLSFGSDDEIGFSSDGDDKRKGGTLQDFTERRRQNFDRNPRNKLSHSEDDEALFGSDSEGGDDRQSFRERKNRVSDESDFEDDDTSAGRNGRFRHNNAREMHKSNGDRNSRSRDGEWSRGNERSYGEKRDGGRRANDRNGGFRPGRGGRDGDKTRWNEDSYGERRNGGRRGNERNDDFRSSDRFDREGRSGQKRRDNFNEFSDRRNKTDKRRDFGRGNGRRDNFDQFTDRNRMGRDRDFGGDKPRRRVIER